MSLSSSALSSTSTSSPSTSTLSNHHCFTPDTTIPCALILLNTTSSSFEALDRVWKATNYHILADGAANHLYRTIVIHSLLENFKQEKHETTNTSTNTFLTLSTTNNILSLIPSSLLSIPSPSQLSPSTISLLKSYLPDCIMGDWDSIQPEIEIFYKSLGVPMIKDPDQYSTDLMKCLNYIDERSKTSQQLTKVIIYGAFGGRLDQEMNNLNILYKYTNKFRQVTLLSNDCLACLLPKGITNIEIAYPYEGPLCGLIPLGLPVASLTTTGLHWDVTNWSTAINGDSISTSNHIDGYPYSHPLDESTHNQEKKEIQLPMMVKIETSDPIIWTASVHM